MKVISKQSMKASSKRGYIGLIIVVVAVIIILLSLFASHANADGPGVMVAREMTHDEGTNAVYVDYTGSFYSGYIGRWNSEQFGGASNIIALEYRRALGPCFAGIGPSYIDQTTSLNGTQWNFSISIGCGKIGPFDVIARHSSHGSVLGIAEDKPNGGWNFVGLRMGF